MKLFALTIGLLQLSGCNFFDEEYVLDLSKSSIFFLGVADLENVSEFRFRAKGTSSAEGVIELYLDDTVYKTHNVGGKVDFKWAGDWYHPNMKIVYRIQKEGKGTLKIKYKIGYALL